MSSPTAPDPTSPGAVAGASFPVARKGFDPTAVRDFLRRVSQELGRAQHDRERLVRELEQTREASRHQPTEDLDQATVAAKLGEEAARVLSTAHEAAAQIRARADESSSRLVRDAELEAARLRGDAEVEAARRRQEAQEQAENEIESAKVEGREMVAEARAVRERIFSDLTRRRDLAREQIEGLQAGRQQIMDAFRRARGDLDAVIGDLEAQAPSEADEELPPLDLPDTAAVPVTPPANVLVLGEMDVPAAIVERHVGGQDVAGGPDEDELDDGDGELYDAEAEDELDELGAEVLDDEETAPAASFTVITSEVEIFEDAPDDEDGAGVLTVVEELVVVGELRSEVGETEDDAEPEDEAPLDAAELDQPDSVTAEVPVVGSASNEAEAPDADHPSVDDLFARLRASSSDVIARDVLDQDPSAAASEPSPTESAELLTGAAALAQRNAALAPVRTALARQLKRVLADEQNEVLHRLRQRNASLAVDDVLGAAALHPGTYRESAEDHLWAAALAGAHSLSDLEGEELHAALEARSVLDRSLDTLEAELVVPLRGRLSENLEAASDGTEAAATVRATYREWKGRIDELGEDLVRTAYGRAAYAVLTPGTPVCWVLDPSGPGCPDAEDNVLAGAVPAGEPFPTGHRYAPAYRGCRCLLVTDPG
jgi:cell division septum initiation protein DivIVA